MVVSPLIAIAAAAVVATSPGPVFFVQERPGFRGGRIKVRKLRTMTVGSERNTQNQFGVTGKTAGVTTVGRVLRATKIDELPQLWAVVTGEMCLVGPRPIGNALDAELREKIPGFQLRYDVRPGLTSLGQACTLENFPSEFLLDDWSFRSACEQHYVRHRSVRYDLLVLALTALFLARKALPRLPRLRASSTPAVTGATNRRSPLSPFRPSVVRQS
jgi:lipopolysaccharide/colanic/teichoic acid biosynthesis glycosyltransferase